MKVKIFQGDSIVLEGLINKWLKQNDKFHMNFMTQSSGFHEQAKVVMTIVTIWYEEK